MESSMKPWTKKERDTFLERVAMEHANDKQVTDFCARVSDRPPTPKGATKLQRLKERR